MSDNYWAVTVHAGGGSMVEAADPRLAILVPNEQAARTLEQSFNDAIEHHPDRFIQQEWWATCFPISKPSVLTSAVPVPGNPSQVAIDTTAELARLAKD